MPLEHSSLTDKNCFLLIRSYNHDVYRYCGQNANEIQKRTARSISEAIVNNEHIKGPKGKILNVCELKIICFIL